MCVCVCRQRCMHVCYKHVFTYMSLLTMFKIPKIGVINYNTNKHMNKQRNRAIHQQISTYYEHVDIYIYIYIHTHIQVCTRSRRPQARFFVHAHTYTYKHTNIHTYIHRCVHVVTPVYLCTERWPGGRGRWMDRWIDR